MINDKKYWMKRRRYGWGWVPTTWQGGLFVTLQVGIIFTAALQLPPKPAQPTAAQLVRFLVIIAFAIGTIVLISSRTAPKPHWRWGKAANDNPNEDF